jgi:tetracycline 7-halogenase / FADH2 O2-dependent halogenase
MTEHDVVIIGSGIAGSMLGAILAKGGANVVLIDGTQHPRFAVGESTIPHLLVRLHILALRYGVPEIAHLQDINTITRHIGSNFGVKRHFGFQLHRPGEEPDPRESNMAATPKTLYRASHLFRQDSDAYLFQVAVRYGCLPRQNWRVADIELDDDAVTVTGTNGERFRARYLVDASGFRSPLADRLGLREVPSRLRHHSRSLFTHMVGVKPYDDVVTVPARHRPPIRWHEGTLHHTFERGWFWVIPFDNHKASTNGAVSVGLTLDERLYPKPTDMTPEQEFFAFAERFPAVARQFTGARSIREWVSTDRLQYSSTQSVGHRWCLMSHAAGFLDPLFSRGMSNTVEVIDALAWRLLDALADDDFSADRFSYVEQLEQGLLDFNDDLANSSFIAFSHFPLWDAVFRMWGFSSNYGAMRLTRAELQYELSGDDQVFKDLEKAPYTGFWWPDDPMMKQMWDIMVETCLKYEVGEIGGDAAAETLHRMIRESPLPPPAFGYKDPDNQWVHPSLPDLVKFLRWALMSGPDSVQQLARGTLQASIRKGVRRQKIV